MLPNEYGVKKRRIFGSMNYRKLTASRIFDGSRFVADHVLVLTPDGVVEALVPVADAGDDIEVYEGILTPGFVNCHCHLELSHMRGKIPEKTGLVEEPMLRAKEVTLAADVRSSGATNAIV